MKKLIIIILILFATSVFAQDTVKSFTKIVNYGKQNKEVFKCVVINNGQQIDTVCVKVEQSLQAQAYRDIDNDSTISILKQKIENDYKSDLKTFQELQTKIIKEEAYLEILNYILEEKNKIK
jgi:serine protease inhibitor ecotin